MYGLEAYLDKLNVSTLNLMCIETMHQTTR